MLAAKAIMKIVNNKICVAIIHSIYIQKVTPDDKLKE